MDPAILGIALVAIGVVIFMVVRLLLRISAKTPPPDLANQLVIGDDPLSEDQNAVLIIKTGGKVVSINKKARELLRLKATESANLD